MDLDRQPGAVLRLARRRVAATACARRRDAARRRSSGTASSCSCGSTSRNQPTAPATSRAPRRRRSPRGSSPGRRGASVTPNAEHQRPRRRRGQVDAPWARLVRARLAISARPRRRREHDDPDGVDEVPVQGEHVGALGVLALHVAARAPARARSSAATSPTIDVRGVQADERVVGGAEEVRADGQARRRRSAASTRAPCRRGRRRRAAIVSDPPEREASAPARRAARARRRWIVSCSTRGRSRREHRQVEHVGRRAGRVRLLPM